VLCCGGNRDRSNRPVGTGYFLVIPGTSCLATISRPSGTKAISLSLRDKLKPWTDASTPFWGVLSSPPHRLTAFDGGAGVSGVAGGTGEALGSGVPDDSGAGVATASGTSSPGLVEDEGVIFSTGGSW
jgi:hypothetical protein